MNDLTRRSFLSQSIRASAALSIGGALGPVAYGSEALRAAVKEERGLQMQFGLVTYLWGQDWNLPTLIENCEKARVHGVELRTTHKHGVERNLTAKQREEVKKRFERSSVTLVGLGSNENFDNPDPKVLAKAIEATKDFIRLSHDVGGSGVKVKPNSFHKGVPREATIRQIGESLQSLGDFAKGFGQEIRLEVHGQCAELPTIKQIMDIAKHPSVAVCWNSNKQDLQGKGLEHNFDLVKERFGRTAHVRKLDRKDYPYAKFISMLVKMDYEGWILIEESDKPADRVAALARQAKLFTEMVKRARAGLGRAK